MTLDPKAMTVEQAVAEAKALFAKGETEAAEGLALAILNKNPKDPQATQVFAAVAESRGQTERAVRILRDSLTGASTDALALTNLCRVLRINGRLEEALEAGEAAVKFGTVPEALADLSDTYYAMGNAPKALETAERAVARRPELIRARLSLAQALLRSGDYHSGWFEYEWRHQMTPRRFKQAQWSGMALSSSRLLVFADAGPSECILFARYLPLIAKRVKNFVVGCTSELKPLIEHTSGVKHIYDRWDAIPAFEYQAPITGLPLIFGTTIDTVPPTGYLEAPADRVAAWRGRLSQIANGRKAIGVALRQAEAINAVASDNVALVSLIRSSDPRVTDVSGEVKGLADFAALVAALDSVVGEDSVGVQLAGAFGRPGVALLSTSSDWIWPAGRTTSPWYPTLKTARSIGELSSVAKQVLAR